MSQTLIEETVPLTLTPQGVYKIGKTRIPLDNVVYAFHNGYSPEEIVMQYDTLKLVEVYQVIGYYLNHKEEIDEYIKEREKEAEEMRKLNEKRFNTAGIREKLLARKALLNNA